MRDYGTVPTTLWTDPAFMGLSREARELLLYLRTGPHGNAIGCFRCPLGYLAADLRSSTGNMQLVMAELVQAGFVAWCERTEWVYVQGGLDDARPPNARGRAMLRNMARRVPRDSAVMAAFAGAWELNQRRLGPLEEPASTGEPHGEAHREETCSSPAGSGLMADQDQERDQDQSLSQDRENARARPRAAGATCEAAEARQGMRAGAVRVNGHRHLGAEQQSAAAIKRERWRARVTQFVQRNATAAEIAEFASEVGAETERGKELLERWNRRMRTVEAARAGAAARESRDGKGVRDRAMRGSQ